MDLETLVQVFLDYQPVYDLDRSVNHKYTRIAHAGTFLFDELVIGSPTGSTQTGCFEATPLEYTTSAIGSDVPGELSVSLTPETVQRLRGYLPTTPFSLFSLDSIMDHAQLLYIDNRNRTFTIIDPLGDNPILTDRLAEVIGSELSKPRATAGGYLNLAYREQPLVCPRGPQVIFNEPFCGAWALLIAFLICRSGLSPSEITDYLVAQPPTFLDQESPGHTTHALERLITRFIQYCYDLIADRPGFIPALELFIVANTQRIDRRYLIPKKLFNDLSIGLNLRALSGDRHLTSYMNRELDRLSFYENPLYRLLAQKNITQAAGESLIDLETFIDAHDLNLDPFYQLILRIPNIETGHVLGTPMFNVTDVIGAIGELPYDPAVRGELLTTTMELLRSRVLEARESGEELLTTTEQELISIRSR